MALTTPVQRKTNGRTTTILLGCKREGTVGDGGGNFGIPSLRLPL
jgi:hypothetical protein